MALRFSQLTPATQLNDTDIFAITQSLNSKSITADLTAKYTMRNSSYADVIETIISNKDYLSSELEPDHRIFVNVITSDKILGFFNGAIRDGCTVNISCIGTGNNIVNIELVSDGITDYILSVNENITIIWDDTNSKWIVISQQTTNIYSVIVNNQNEFNSIIERIGVNQYQIKSNIKSVYFKFLSGGYKMFGTGTPLSGGDTWGYIKTGSCVMLYFEPGTYFEFWNTQGYIEIDTTDCILQNIIVKGLSASSIAIQRSFLLNASNVTYINCSSNSRTSNTNFYVFEGSTTAIHNETSQYIGCKINDCNVSTNALLTGFYKCNNMSKISVINMIHSGTGGGINIFSLCKNVSNVIIKTIYATNATNNLVLSCFNNCNNISNYVIDDINLNSIGTSSIQTITDCINFNNGNITNVNANDDISLLVACEIFNNIYIENIESTNGIVYGFNGCSIINNFYISQMNGSLLCTGIFTGIKFNNGTIDNLNSSGGVAYGFNAINHFSLCSVSNCDDGFNNCDYGTNNHAFNNTNDGFKDCNTIGFSRATGNAGNGFDTCNHLEHNVSNGNTGANYLNSFADLAGTRTADVSDSGGDNA